MKLIKLTALLVGALLLLPSATTGKDKEYKVAFNIHGTIVLTAVDVLNKPGLYNMVDIGESTHLGRYYNVGWLQFIPNPSDPTGAPLILAGAGKCTPANEKGYSAWTMEPMTGRVLMDGANSTGRYVGEEGYFDSTITSLVMSEDMTSGVSTYVGRGFATYAK